MRKASAAEARDRLLAASVVWPIAADAWMTGILAGLTDDPACRAAPLGYFLVPDGKGRLVCVAKETAGER